MTGWLYIFQLFQNEIIILLLSEKKTIEKTKEN